MTGSVHNAAWVKNFSRSSAEIDAATDPFGDVRPPVGWREVERGEDRTVWRGPGRETLCVMRALAAGDSIAGVLRRRLREHKAKEPIAEYRSGWARDRAWEEYVAGAPGPSQRRVKLFHALREGRLHTVAVSAPPGDFGGALRAAVAANPGLDENRFLGGEEAAPPPGARARAGAGGAREDQKKKKEPTLF